MNLTLMLHNVMLACLNRKLINYLSFLLVIAAPISLVFSI